MSLANNNDNLEKNSTAIFNRNSYLISNLFAPQSTAADLLCDYLAANPSVSDVLFTGGDPMVMSARQLQRYLAAIVEDRRLDHVSTVRIGSKSLAYWPYRYVTDPDAGDILR